MNKIITLVAVSVTAIAALTLVSTAQNQPVAAPVNRTDAHFATFPNVHHNAITNTVYTTFTNSTVKVSPGKAFTLSVTVTNAPGIGTMTNHFNVSHDNGATFAGSGTNGALLVPGTFTYAQRSNTLTFYLYVANTHNYTDLQFIGATTLTTGTTNVFAGKAVVTTANP